ncbi:hypothetical protein PR003_g7292 [Phytophthora rubi]|uniref:Helicase-associated domain-containing protein n=1 Tax=Phytophthora rubi TaxID=129364 RepID=A0A6A3NF82_9STRA|nr:hypothetical protein PR001_g6918 [Phytophthora rubi]KAE9346696.1 hypothetical protein PR003_g7292 [Phytophthora rubi]
MDIGNAAEIFQQPLTLALLTLYHVGIAPHEFHWIEAPSEDALKRAQEELLYLGAVDSQAQKGLTQVGVDLAAVMSVAGIAYYRGKKNDKVSKSEADKKLESLLIPDQGDVVSLYRTYRAWKAELERTSGDTEEASTIPEPDLTADNDGEGNADEDDGELDATFAKQALQLKMDSDSSSGWIKSLTGWVFGGKNRNEDDDDNRSVVSTDSEASVASMASDASSPSKPKKPKRKFNEKKARAWCMKNGVNHKAMSIAQATAKELHKTLSRAKSWGYSAVGGNGNPSDDQLRRLITAGYFLNAAVNKPKVAGKLSRGGPQYFALYSGVLGSLFYGTSMHLLEKRSGTLPSWILFDSILRLDTTTHLKLATPIDEAWIKEESQEFYDMCMSKRSELPVETIEFDNLSFTLLRSLFGKAFQQINRWEAQLKCTMSIDRNTNTLTVYCAPVNEPQIRASLDKRISALKTRLEEESIEEVYLGTTRVILGNGFEVRELLFDKDFAAVTVRNLADQTDREVEKRLMQWVKRAKSSAASVRSVEILRHNNSGTASVSAVKRKLTASTNLCAAIAVVARWAILLVLPLFGPSLLSQRLLEVPSSLDALH